MSKISQFFNESKAELRKVVWPSRDDDFSLFFKIGCLEDLLSSVSYPKWNKIHLMANEFQEVLDQEVKE